MNEHTASTIKYVVTLGALVVLVVKVPMVLMFVPFLILLLIAFL